MAPGTTVTSPIHWPSSSCSTSTTNLLMQSRFTEAIRENAAPRLPALRSRKIRCTFRATERLPPSAVRARSQTRPLAATCDRNPAEAARGPACQTAPATHRDPPEARQCLLIAACASIAEAVPCVALCCHVPRSTFHSSHHVIHPTHAAHAVVVAVAAAAFFLFLGLLD